MQEGLTNALRYAASAHRVDVTVEHVDGSVQVDVTTTPPSPDPRARQRRQGTLGMRERVALYGGTLEAGPAGSGDGGCAPSSEADAATSGDTAGTHRARRPDEAR